MKNATALLLLFLLIISCGNTQQYKNISKPHTIAVSTIINNTDESISKKTLYNITDHLIAELTKTNRFIVVERKKLDKIIKEHELSMTGLLKQKDAKKIGNMLQAEYIVIVSLASLTYNTKKYNLELANYSKIDISMVFNARIISIDSGTLVAVASITHNAINNEFKISLDTEHEYAFGSNPDKINPQVEEEFFKAMEKLSTAINENGFKENNTDK